MNKLLFTLLLVLAGLTSLPAEIAILATSHSDFTNGCNGTITVRAKGTAGKRFQSEIFTTEAQAKGGDFPLNLKGLQKGIYFVRVIRGDGAEGTAKVLIQ
ncbi:MAG: hypothetical protein AAF840_05865 [Bacteroidota bacterium]